MDPKPLRIEQFDSHRDFDGVAPSRQHAHLRSYLADLGVRTVVEEPYYFDRDYLAEFAAFYSTSARGYTNVCRRLHFFADASLDRAHLEEAIGGDEPRRERLQDAYRGFVVVRPIPNAPLGRTVLAWYKDDCPGTPRVTSPCRDYTCHLAGFPLTVKGLAWQQQDMGVGACATVALWSMLHSSAFDDHHAIPTTASITRLAHKTASLGARVFPSVGLSYWQICEAIKECELSPAVSVGDVKASGLGGDTAFSRDRFAGSCAAFVRSGYPVLIGGHLVRSGGKTDCHAVCAVGFRQCTAPAPTPGQADMQDGAVEHVYVHDDNIGPSARFQIVETGKHILLRRDPPVPRHPAPHVQQHKQPYPDFVPTRLVAAVHEELRTAPDWLHDTGLRVARGLILASGGKLGLALSSRFITLPKYLEVELGDMLGTKPDLLAKARLALCETISPMSRHLGLVRFGYGMRPVLDVLFDTTDSKKSLSAFCNLAFSQIMPDLVQPVSKIIPLGGTIRVY